MLDEQAAARHGAFRHCARTAVRSAVRDLGACADVARGERQHASRGLASAHERAEASDRGGEPPDVRVRAPNVAIATSSLISSPPD